MASSSFSLIVPNSDFGRESSRCAPLCLPAGAQVEALALVSGSAASSDCVRAPAGCAVIEAMYSLDVPASAAARALLAACGLPAKALPGADRCDGGCRGSLPRPPSLGHLKP